MKKAFMIILAVIITMSLTACGKECANGCGEKPDQQCMAEMCDKCCNYWMGINGCYKDH